MAALQRITTEYIEAEDRVRLTGEFAPEQTMVLWLTQRLLNRLLPHLFKRLNAQTGDGLAADIRQEFAQQAAMAALQSQAAVHRQSQSETWLVHSVNVLHDAQGVHLIFKSVDVPADMEVASLTLQAQPLRQWLTILHDQCRKSEWPLNVWPPWVGAVRSASTHPPVLMH